MLLFMVQSQSPCPLVQLRLYVGRYRPQAHFFISKFSQWWLLVPCILPFSDASSNGWLCWVMQELPHNVYIGHQIMKESVTLTSMMVMSRISSAILSSRSFSICNYEFVEYWSFIMGSVTQRKIWKMCGGGILYHYESLSCPSDLELSVKLLFFHQSNDEMIKIKILAM